MTIDYPAEAPVPAKRPPDTLLRKAIAADATVLAGVHTDARAAGMAWLPRLHTLEETRAWFEYVVLPHQHVTVAEAAGQALGFSAVDEGWLEQLYVTPTAQSRGLRQALLQAALDEHSDGLCLRVFTRNTRARAFYERAGFVCVNTSDGSTNEKHEPDCTYAYPPP